MSVKASKIIFWITTGLLAVMSVMAVVMYITKFDDVAEVVIKMGFPTYIIYFLAFAKPLALIAIITRISPMLKEWAYSGLFFVYTLAVIGHVMAEDGEFVGAIVAAVLLLASYFTGKKAFKKAD